MTLATTDLDGHAATSAAITAILDGLTGDSGPLALHTFTAGVRNTPSGGGGGGSAGKVQFDAVRFTKPYDAASPKLLLRTASGQHLPSATFTLRKPGATVTYKLSDVVVTGYEQDGLDDAVELLFSRVQVTFQPAKGAPVSAGWDVKLNQSI